MPAKTEKPSPKLRLNKGIWQVIWNYDGKQYCISTGRKEDDKLGADFDRSEIAVALGMSKPSFPAKYHTLPAVQRYCAARYNTQSPPAPAVIMPKKTGDPVQDYITENAPAHPAVWIKTQYTALRRVQSEIGDPLTVTAGQLQAWANGILRHCKPWTQHRYLNTLASFYRWAILNKYMPGPSPTIGIKRAKIQQSMSITYCTKEERAEIINIAMKTGHPVGIAVPIAFYSGMRRGEISRLNWQDISFDRGIIVVQQTKTGRARVVPLHPELHNILVKHGRKESGKVIAFRGADHIEALHSFALRLQSKHGKIAHLITWNVFRHTFGSLLAQAGVSLDKISSWMGNTPEICRRHYAQFIPKDLRDNDIEKM